MHLLCSRLVERESGSAAPIEPQALAEQLAALSADNTRLAREREQYRELYLRTLEQCRKLERGILAGQKAERLSKSDAQLTLALLGTLLAERELADSPDAKPPAPKPRKEPRRPTGRKPLPESLPRVEIEVLPEEVQREGLNAFERIGEEVCEVVERRPGSLVVLRIRKPKFVRKDRMRSAATQVAVAPAPERPLQRGLAGPALLADTIVRRWQDHLPLNRLEQVYAREGLELARSTLCTWHTELAQRVQPLIEAMWQDAHRSPYLCTDATGVLMQAKERCRTGHFFVVIAPERHVLFHYASRHDGEAVDEILSGYSGYLVADAHSIFDHLYAEGEVIEVGCWAHGRRYFFKALGSDPERARVALGLIGKLFEIEREHASAMRRERQQVRARLSQPIADAFFAWCERERDAVLDDTPIAAAIRYALNQRAALRRFLDDGALPLSNNISERALRRQAVGRKNWIFLGSADGAVANATFVSLLASCQMHRIEPGGYLRDLFCLLPDWPARRVLDLAPVAWRQTLEQPEAQQRLAANPFRALSLGLTR